MPVTIERELVTPELAAEWLDLNKKNRNESSSEVNRYAGELLTDNWYETGDTVKFDWDGVLADGQHRLSAIIRSEKSEYLWVARGIDPKARIAMDDGRTRKFADDLQMDMVASSVRIESLIRKIMLWDMFQSPISSTGRIPRSALKNLWEKERPRITTALEVSGEHTSVPCSQPVRDFVTFLLLSVAPEKMVHKYLQTLTIGSQDDNDLPLVNLRDRLTRDKYEAKAMGKNTSTAASVWYMLRGWNAWVTGERLFKYNLPRGGLRKGTPFPMPVAIEYKEKKDAPRRA